MPLTRRMKGYSRKDYRPTTGGENGLLDLINYSFAPTH